jgi:hypothetical protein
MTSLPSTYLLTLAAAVAMVAAPLPAAEPTKPNIVFILADDKEQ